MKFFKYITFLSLGIVFGIVLTQAEVISWFRIYEMFHFKSFHMFGIIGSAIFLGIILLYLLRNKTKPNTNIDCPSQRGGFLKFMGGGTLFGLGWALTGACPGPMFILLGSGFGIFLVVIAAALLGTFVYGLVSHKLP